jgi:hypothetical protein
VESAGPCTVREDLQVPVCVDAYTVSELTSMLPSVHDRLQKPKTAAAAAAAAVKSPGRRSTAPKRRIGGWLTDAVVTLMACSLLSCSAHLADALIALNKATPGYGSENIASSSQRTPAS